MDVRGKVKAAAAVILRIPALFLLDALCLYHLYGDDTIIFGPGFPYLYAAPALLVALETMPFNTLMVFNMYTRSLDLSSLYVMVEILHSSDDDSLPSVFESNEASKRLLIFLFVQTFMTSATQYMVELQGCSRYAILIFAFPMIARVFVRHTFDLEGLYLIFVAIVTLMAIFNMLRNLRNVLSNIKTELSDAFETVLQLGVSDALVIFWHRAKLTQQLVVFWIGHLLYHVHLKRNSTIYRRSIQENDFPTYCSTPIRKFAMAVTATVIFETIVTFLFRRHAHRNNNMARDQTRAFIGLLVAVVLAVTTDSLPDLSSPTLLPLTKVVAKLPTNGTQYA